VVVSYKVTGTTAETSDQTVRFSWDVLKGLSLPVTEVTGTLRPPLGVREYDCQAGSADNLRACSTYSGGLHGGMEMTFTNSQLPSGELVRIGVILDPGTTVPTQQVSQRWFIGNAFAVGLTQLILVGVVLGVGLLVLGGLWLRNRTQYSNAQPADVGGFQTGPDGLVHFQERHDIPPGMVGTVIDGRVDPADIVATVLDLAVRGHLHITEVARTSYSEAPDWLISPMKNDAPLLDYEQRLLEILMPNGHATRVADLTEQVAPAIGQVQESIYQEVRSHGWFSRHPAAPNPWTKIAWIGLAVACLATIVLAALTSYALVGVAAIIVAGVGVLVSRENSPVTPAGSAVMAGLAKLTTDLHERPTEDLPTEHVLAEASEALPFAVVLGGWNRWLNAMVLADDDDDPDPHDIPWYHAGPDWHLQDLPISLEAFITIVTGRLFTRV
jgi:hypothetical protein